MMTNDSRYEEMRDQCKAWHKQHPLVWQLFIKFTFDRINRGFKHYSAKAVFERIRWETDQANVNPKEQFKCNNNYHSFYARAFMNKHPDHDGFFRVRWQLSKEGPPTNRPELTPSDFF